MVINAPGQERGCLWGIWSLFGAPSAFTAVCSMGSFSLVEKFKVEEDEGRADVCCSLGFDCSVSMCDESSG